MSMSPDSPRVLYLRCGDQTVSLWSSQRHGEGENIYCCDLHTETITEIPSLQGMSFQLAAELKAVSDIPQ